MLPRVEATSQLQLINAVKLGMGAGSQAASLISRLQIVASGERRARRADPGALALMGIGVVVVPQEVSDE